MKMEENRPRIGVGVMIVKKSKVLLGLRKGAHGAGEWGFPGGHLEYLESYKECALREIAEECGIQIKNLRFEFLANVGVYKPRHYVHIGMIAEWKSGEPKVLEPEKCAEWRWFPLEKLPKPMMHMAHLAIKSYKSGQVFYDLK